METGKSSVVFLPRFLEDLEECPLAYGGVGVKGSQGSMGSHLIDEYQARRVDAGEFHAPQEPQELAPL